jgi:signal transduction histidine kinase
MMLEDPPTPKVGKQVGAINTLGSNMADMIKRLLDVHAIEAGRAEAPLLVTMALGDVVDKAQGRAVTSAGRKGITLEVSESPPVEVQGDPAHVGQILDNFISNALKFSSPGTTITLLVQGKGLVGKVLVKDQGPGLTPEDLDRVFGEYARLSARPTAGEASVGLGLSLVKRMAEAMGGSVGVESIPGEGATFWLALPKT